MIQPILTSAIEVVIWMAIINSMVGETLGGFGREYYLAYALWANFVGRVAMNWMYEFTMLNDIETGSVNTILVRPISFYGFYLSQYVAYKMLTATISLGIPIAVCLFLKAPMHVERLPLMFVMLFGYLIFAHTMSFCVACLAFFMSRASSLTAMKNLAIWVLTGELIPLDLYPEPFRSLLMTSPFACGVYLPVAFITGRVGHEAMLKGFFNLACGLAVMALLASVLWRRGVRSYTGTGA